MDKRARREQEQGKLAEVVGWLAVQEAQRQDQARAASAATEQERVLGWWVERTEVQGLWS